MLKQTKLNLRETHELRIDNTQISPNEVNVIWRDRFGNSGTNYYAQSSNLLLFYFLVD